MSIQGGQRLHPVRLPVPGDISSATFWMALAAGTPGASVEIQGVGLNPSRTDIVDLIRRAGAGVTTEVEGSGEGEPIGRLLVTFDSPRSFTIEPEDVPGIIDEIPALAALAAMMPPGAELVVRGAAELRLKESDRISALATGLRAMGSEVEEFRRWLPPSRAPAPRRDGRRLRRSPAGDGVRRCRHTGLQPDDDSGRLRCRRIVSGVLRDARSAHTR